MHENYTNEKDYLKIKIVYKLKKVSETSWHKKLTCLSYQKSIVNVNDILFMHKKSAILLNSTFK